jgi:hypothetical protein
MRYKVLRLLRTVAGLACDVVGLTWRNIEVERRIVV